EALGRTILGSKENIKSLTRDDLANYIKTNYTADRMVLVEIRLQDDTMAQAHIAIAVEGCGWTSPDYYTMLVMQSIIGTWDRSLGASAHTSSRLSTIVHQNKLANSFMSFNTS
ncbi:hypothetical protein BGZ58_006841, partial [Dissophora ornata]